MFSIFVVCNISLLILRFLSRNFWLLHLQGVQKNLSLQIAKCLSLCLGSSLCRIRFGLNLG